MGRHELLQLLRVGCVNPIDSQTELPAAGPRHNSLFHDDAALFLSHYQEKREDHSRPHFYIAVDTTAVY